MSRHEQAKRKGFRWLNLLLAVICLLFLVRLGQRVERFYTLQARGDQLAIELAEAQAEYAEKQETVALLDNPAYIERIAREDLGMVRAGETVVTAVRLQPDAVLTAEAPSQTQPAAPAADTDL